ncbi:MAG: hypothetical protein QM800_07755 [Paludibacter sp.]
MKNRFIILAFSIFATLHILAQQKVCTWYDTNQNSNQRGIFCDHISGDTVVKHGKYTIWHQNKNLWQEGMYDHDKLVGLWHDYYETGELKQELPYSNGLLNGIIKLLLSNRKNPTTPLLQKRHIKWTGNELL